MLTEVTVSTTTSAAGNTTNLPNYDGSCAERIDSSRFHLLLFVLAVLSSIFG